MGKSIRAEAFLPSRNALTPTKKMSAQIAIITQVPTAGLQKNCVSQAPTYCISPKGFDISVWKKGVP